MVSAWKPCRHNVRLSKHFLRKLTAGFPKRGKYMLTDRNGQSVVEYIVVLAIFITLVGGALWEVFSTLRIKFNDVNAEIGS
jgi:hypothetical protein